MYIKKAQNHALISHMECLSTKSVLLQFRFRVLNHALNREELSLLHSRFKQFNTAFASMVVTKYVFC